MTDPEQAARWRARLDVIVRNLCAASALEQRLDLCRCAHARSAHRIDLARAACSVCECTLYGEAVVLVRRSRWQVEP